MTDEIEDLKRKLAESERTVSDLDNICSTLSTMLADLRKDYEAQKAWADKCKEDARILRKQLYDLGDKYASAGDQIRNEYQRINYLESLLRRLPVTPEPWEVTND